MESLGNIRNIVMDEVHHYRLEKTKPHWYTRAKEVVAGKGPNGRNGYLWLFLDMFQKENTFNSGNSQGNSHRRSTHYKNEIETHPRTS